MVLMISSGGRISEIFFARSNAVAMQGKELTVGNLREMDFFYRFIGTSNATC